MKELRSNIRAILGAFVVLFVLLSVYIGYTLFINGPRWFSSPYNPVLSQQKQQVISGSITDRSYIVLAGTNESGKRTYHPNAVTRKAVSHVVGDQAGLAAMGLETFAAKYLLGLSGNVFERIYGSLTGAMPVGDTVVSTISAELSAYAYNQLGSSNGAVVVMNYQTGELLALVSKPGYDQTTLDRTQITEGDSFLVNRASSGQYTPGSVFKLVTAAAVLEHRPDLAAKTYTCTGSVAYEDGAVVCANGAVHGELTLSGAVAKSCNCVFAQIMQQINRADLVKTAKAMGYNQSYLFSDLMIADSVFEKAEGGVNEAWAAVGQYKTTTSPLQVTLVTAAIANDGEMMEPRLIREILNKRGYAYKTMKAKSVDRVMSASSAQQLREMMFLAVKSGTAKSAALADYTVGGKTGTAQVSENKAKGNHAWFTGFVFNEQTPYAITVIVENGGSGGSVAAPLARKILKKAIDLEL